MRIRPADLRHLDKRQRRVARKLAEAGVPLHQIMEVFTVARTTSPEAMRAVRNAARRLIRTYLSPIKPEERRT